MAVLSKTSVFRLKFKEFTIKRCQQTTFTYRSVQNQKLLQFEAFTNCTTFWNNAQQEQLQPSWRKLWFFAKYLKNVHVTSSLNLSMFQRLNCLTKNRNFSFWKKPTTLHIIHPWIVYGFLLVAASTYPLPHVRTTMQNILLVAC